MRVFGKINLTLAVTGRRQDGYHLLETVMHPVSIYDEVFVEPGAGINLSADSPRLTGDRKNLAWRAAEEFFCRTGIKPGVNISLRKKIPMGAGMGGGSADAAAVLAQINRIYGEPLNREQMAEAALKIGADVPLFLGDGPALATGVGENLSPVPVLPDCLLVISKPQFSVSTQEAYMLFDQFGRDDGRRSTGLVAALKAGDINGVADNLFNQLEEPVAGRYPQVGDIKKKLIRLGALNAGMTGSGSAVFGIFSDQAKARAAYTELKKSCDETFLASPVAFPQSRV